MKIVQINATCGIGSTGKICLGISRILNAENIENYILCSRSNGYAQGIALSDRRYIKLQALKSRILGNYGFNSKLSTRKMITQLERIQPDIVHLHNLHGHDCDLETLFSWFRRNKTKLIWTFHDCWAFTGYCTYFDMVRCAKWKHMCNCCPQRRASSWFFDKSSWLYQSKREIFRGLDLTIITPSRWLAEMVEQSFMRTYPVQVIYNGIDLDTFQPHQGDFRKKYGLENKKIVLGVAFGWGARKGLDVFVELAKRLPEAYKIVLIGTDAEVDKKLPENILSIRRTQNQRELAEIYTEADVLANPTREEVLGLVNIEALACGTSGVTFNSGGSPECYDDTCGVVVHCDDVDALEREIIRICTDKPYSKEACLKKAREFDQNERFKEYLKLYKSIIG